MRTNTAPNIESLLGQIGWLRALARHLAGSPDVADDIVQDTLSVALRRPPDPQRPLRPWLAGVVRHLLQKRYRDEGRRRVGDGKVVADQTETDCAELTATPETLAHQAKALRVLADLVCELDESQKKIILLRFFEDQTSEQIGEALGMPAGTVRRQQKKTLERLRERMDRKHDGRQAWSGLFLLPKKNPAPVSAATSHVKIGLTLSLLAVTSFVIVAAPLKRQSKLQTATPPTPNLMAILDQPPPSATEALKGLVVDPEGRPIPNAAVLLHCTGGCPIGNETDRVTHTDAGGQFNITSVAKASYVVTASDPEHASATTQLDFTAEVSKQPVRLTLRAGGFTVEGTVLDAGGGGIAGAVIVGTLREQKSLAVTSNEGRYRLRLPRGTHIVSVSADGYADLAGQGIEAAGDITRDFVLTPAATVSGQVIDDNGAPVAGALVMAASDGRAGQPAYSTTTDDGSFRFHNLGTGRTLFSARKGTYWGTSASVPELAATDLLTNLVIAMKMRPAVTGAVENTRGQLLGECTVRIEAGALQASGVQSKVATRCTTSGTFTLDALPAGRFAIQVRTEGYAWSARDFVLADSPLQMKFILEPEAIVKGIVLAADGTPVAGAYVELNTRASHSADAMFTGASSRTTDEHGRFEANRLGAGILQARARHDAFGFVETEQPVAEAKAQQLVLRFAPGAFISGKVLWDDGKPAAKAIARWHSGSQGYQDATDESGAFHIGPVPQGNGELAARSAADGVDRVGGPPSAERKYLFVKAGMTHSENLLVLKRANLSISGRVIDADQHPIGNARIIVGEPHEAERVALNDAPLGPRTHEATSDSEGRFTVVRLVKGTYQVVALTSQHPPAIANEVASQSQHLVLQLSRPSQVRGLVADHNGVPLTTFEVTAAPSPPPFDPKQPLKWLKTTPFPSFGGAPRAHQWTKSADGTFVIDNLSEGIPYDIRVRTPDELFGGHARFTPSLAKPGFVTITAYKGQTVRGCVVDMETGTPLPGMGVALGNRSDLFAARTDDQGVFRVGGIFPGMKEYLDLRVFPRHIGEVVGVDVPADGRDIDVGSIDVMALPPEPKPRTAGDVPTMGMVSTGIMLVPGSHPPQVAFVMPGSPAAATGIETGNIITAIDGHDMRSGAGRAAWFLLDGPLSANATVKVQAPGGVERVVLLEKVSAEKLGMPTGP